MGKRRKETRTKPAATTPNATTAARRDRLTPFFVGAVPLLGLIYICFNWTPSSYRFVLDTLDAKGTGPVFGESQFVRTDEWSIETPFFQACVRNAFHRINETSLYREDLRNFYALPLADWRLIFKPQLWAFFVGPPALAYSVYWALFMCAFLAGYYFVSATRNGSASSRVRHGDAVLNRLCAILVDDLCSFVSRFLLDSAHPSSAYSSLEEGPDSDLGWTRVRPFARVPHPADHPGMDGPFGHSCFSTRPVPLTRRSVGCRGRCVRDRSRRVHILRGPDSDHERNRLPRTSHFPFRRDSRTRRAIPVFPLVDLQFQRI